MSEADDMQEAKNHQMHVEALRDKPKNGDQAPETLRYISEPEDIETPSEAMEWINSRSAATSNLSEADVESKEWIIEYANLLSKLEHPPKYGLTGAERAWAYDDADEYKQPLSVTDRLKREGFGEIGKEAATKAKEGWGTETATSETRESIVHDQGDGGGGGLRGRLGL